MRIDFWNLDAKSRGLPKSSQSIFHMISLVNMLITNWYYEKKMLHKQNLKKMDESLRENFHRGVSLKFQTYV